MKNEEYISICGLNCGLCPRFHSSAKSRCEGCRFTPAHDYCSLYRCCVTKQGLFSCANCTDFTCERYIRVSGVSQGLDSFISHKPIQENLERIKKEGLASVATEQAERRKIAAELIREFNEGRSCTFYCTAAALISIESIKKAVADGKQAIQERLASMQDMKTIAKIMKTAIQSSADREGVNLKLRKAK